MTNGPLGAEHLTLPEIHSLAKNNINTQGCQKDFPKMNSHSSSKIDSLAASYTVQIIKRMPLKLFISIYGWPPVWERSEASEKLQALRTACDWLYWWGEGGELIQDHVISCWKKRKTLLQNAVKETFDVQGYMFTSFLNEVVR